MPRRPIALALGCLLMLAGLTSAGPLTVRVVDERNEPVAGVTVTRFLAYCADKNGTWEEQFIRSIHEQLLDDDGEQTNANGIVELSADDVALLNYADQPITLWAIDHATGRMATGAFDPTGDATLTLTLAEPARVTGRVVSPDLAEAGRTIAKTTVYGTGGTAENYRFQGDGDRFELLLPPGEAEVMVVGTGGYFIDRALTLTAGEQVDLGDIDVGMKRWLMLEGKPAPELEGIVEWRNTPEGGLTLEDLRGKVVLLHFWGVWCGNCHVEVAELLPLYDELKPLGLEVIAVHDASETSLDVALPKMEQMRQTLWGGRSMPWPIALDSGKQTPIPGAPDGVWTDGRTTANFGVTSFPTGIVIGRDGVVLRTFDARVEEDVAWLRDFLSPADSAPAPATRPR